jgi:hypothetical protein
MEHLPEQGNWVGEHLRERGVIFLTIIPVLVRSRIIRALRYRLPEGVVVRQRKHISGVESICAYQFAVGYYGEDVSEVVGQFVVGVAACAVVDAFILQRYAFFLFTKIKKYRTCVV